MFTGSRGTVTQSHVYSSISYNDLNRQQIDLRCNCTVNITGNRVNIGDFRVSRQFSGKVVYLKFKVKVNGI